MGRKTRLRTVNNKIDMERNIHDSWRTVICINLHASTEAQKKYIEALETYDLNNHITKAARTGRKLIDHIISNILANKILHLFRCITVSNNQLSRRTLYHCKHAFNKFETRYKYISNLKNFELEKYVQD